MFTRSNFGDAILGSFDGLTNSVGLMVGLISNPATMLLAVTIFCLTNAFGMSAARFISTKTGRLQTALVVGGFSFAAGILPAIPFILFTKTLALVLAAIVAVLVSLGIGTLKYRLDPELGLVAAYLQTFVVVLAVCAIAVVPPIIGV